MENIIGFVIILGKEVGSFNGDLEFVKVDVLCDKFNGLKNQVDDIIVVFEKLGDDIVVVLDEKIIQVFFMVLKVKIELEELGFEVKCFDDGLGCVNIEFFEGYNILIIFDQLGVKVIVLLDGCMDIIDNVDDVK